MRYFMKFYPDCTIGTVEQVDDSMTLLSGNDEKGVFNWIEVFDKQQLATARREGWEHGKKESEEVAENHRYSPDHRNQEWCCCDSVIADAIAAMEYRENKEDLKNWCAIEGVAP